MARKDQKSATVAGPAKRAPDEAEPRRKPARHRPRTFIRVGKRGQIVLPATLRRELGIEDGSTLAVRADERGQVVLEPVSSDPIEQFIEVGRKIYEGVDTEAYIRSLRDEWDD